MDDVVVSVSWWRGVMAVMCDVALGYGWHRRGSSDGDHKTHMHSGMDRKTANRTIGDALDIFGLQWSWRMQVNGVSVNGWKR